MSVNRRLTVKRNAVYKNNSQSRTMTCPKTLTREEQLYNSLAQVLQLALIKWGNLDPDANTVFNRAHALLETPPAQPVAVVRLMKTPVDDGPIAGERIAQRAMQICGCEGKFDCNCVSVLNQARCQLWAEHNQTARAAG